MNGARYVEAALTREAAAFVGPDGDPYGHALHAAAVRIGGLLHRHEPTGAEEILVAAAVDAGWRERAARSNVSRGLRWGREHPRSTRSQFTRSVVPPGRIASAYREHSRADSRLAARSLPPSNEVAVFWERCVPIHEDDEVSAWFVSRGLEPDAVAASVPVRALPRRLTVPRWARWHGPWNASGHRAIFAAYDALGRLASVHARAIVPVGEDGRKSLAPAGYAVRGAVLADQFALRLLRGEKPTDWDGGIVVVEGEPNLCAWATVRSDADESPRHATLGIVAGAWTPAIAARIPDGSTVVLDVDHDKAGDGYAAFVASTLAPGVTVLRTQAEAAS